MSDSKGLQSGLSSAARPRSDAPQGRQSAKNLPQARKGKKKKKKKKKRREAASKTDFRYTAQAASGTGRTPSRPRNPLFPAGKRSRRPRWGHPHGPLARRGSPLETNGLGQTLGPDGTRAGRNTEGWRFTGGPLRKDALFALLRRLPSCPWAAGPSSARDGPPPPFLPLLQPAPFPPSAP